MAIIITSICIVWCLAFIFLNLCDWWKNAFGLSLFRGYRKSHQVPNAEADAEDMKKEIKSAKCWLVWWCFWLGCNVYWLICLVYN